MKYLFLILVCCIFISGIKSQTNSSQSIQEIKQLKEIILSEGAVLTNQKNGNWEEYVLDSILHYKFNSPDDSVLSRKREYLYPEEGLTMRIAYNWNVSAAAWQPDQRYIYVWDLNDNLTEYTRQHWDEIAMDWVDSYYMQMTYNAAGQEILFIWQVWDEGLGNLVNYIKDENSYDNEGAHTGYWDWMWDEGAGEWTGNWHTAWMHSGSGLLETKIDYGWDDEGGDWSAETKEEYAYDSNDFLVKTDGYNISPISGLWMLTNKTDYTNNSAGDPEIILQSTSSDNGTTWFFANKTEIFYNTSGEEILQFHYVWNIGLQDWEYSSKIELGWDGFGNQVVRKFYTWEEELPGWKLQNLAEWEYNSAGTLLMAAVYSFNINAGLFMGDYKMTYSLNPDGYPMTSFNFLWDPVSSDWFLDEKGFYYYTITTDIPYVQSTAIALFPNPAKSGITVQGPFIGTIRYEVISGSGSLVKRGTASSPILNIDIGDLPCGTYFLRLENGINKFRKTFIKK